MTTVIIVAAIMAILGIIILCGKGDGLIAGYNTASKEEKEKYNVKRLRLLIGLFLIVLAIVILFSMMNGSTSSSKAIICVVLPLAFIVILLANTWAKKK